MTKHTTLFKPGDLAKLGHFGRLVTIHSIVDHDPEHEHRQRYLIRWADTGDLIVRDIPWYELEPFKP